MAILALLLPGCSAESAEESAASSASIITDEDNHEGEDDHGHNAEVEMLTLSALAALELSGEPLRVVETTSIIGDVVAQVGGDAINLTVLMEPGQDLHRYEPSTLDLTSGASAHLIFINGWNLEEGLVDNLANIGMFRANVDAIVAGLQ